MYRRSAYAEGVLCKCAEYRIDPRELVKQAWIFSLPLAGMDLPSSAAQLPYYAAHAATGPTARDSTSRLKSVGLAGMALLTGLFGIGFGGQGLKHLGQKLGVLAAKAKGGAVPSGLADMARKMEEPAFRRFAAAGQERMGAAGRYAGMAVGGIAHPFNKLEDAITSGIRKSLGPASESVSGGLISAGDKLQAIPGVSIASSPWMIPPLIAGSMLQPGASPEQQMMRRREAMLRQNLT